MPEPEIELPLYSKVAEGKTYFRYPYITLSNKREKKSKLWYAKKEVYEKRLAELEPQRSKNIFQRAFKGKEKEKLDEEAQKMIDE
ncbi:hypothetical protein BLA29_014739, partial [Euroglyphus maynei]